VRKDTVFGRGEISARRHPAVHSAIGFIIFGSRLQRDDNPGSFGDWLYHFRERRDFSAGEQPRFAWRLPPLPLFFLGKEKEEGVDGADLACSTTKGDHMRANKSRGGTKEEDRGWRALRPPRVVCYRLVCLVISSLA